MYEVSLVQVTNIRSHSMADRLQVVNFNGDDVIVDMSVAEGSWGLYWPTDGMISFDLLNDLKLFRKNPQTGETWTGFFEPDCRVKAVKLRGEKSCGFFLPLEVVINWLSSKEKNSSSADFKSISDELKTIDGVTTFRSIELGRKYITSATQNARSAKVGVPGIPKVKISEYFKLHYDTGNLYNAHIVSDDNIVVTIKAHGTSGRFGYLPVVEIDNSTWTKRLYNWWARHTNQPQLTVTNYKYFNGTRNTSYALDVNSHKVNSDSVSYRESLVRPLFNKLYPGEQLYFEIVGFTGINGTPIQKGSAKGDKELTKKYGQSFPYSYGCSKDGTSGPVNKILVYRITQLLNNGQIIEYTDSQMRIRCKQLGLEPVELIENKINISKQGLLKHVENLLELESNRFSEHPNEGFCIRIENDKMIKIFKIKSFEFKISEGITKNDSSYIDEEESS